MSEDLRTFFRACLDTVERLAVATLENQPLDEWTAAGPDDGPKTGGAGWQVPGITDLPPTRAAEALARHIARHDPHAVLADVRAMRLILDHNATLHQFADPGTGPDEAYTLAAAASDRALKLIAWRYRDEPGYRDEWLPQ